MHPDRLTYLIEGKKNIPKKYILYWMQQSMRVSFNHALAFAIDIANKQQLPLVVCFLLTDGYLNASRRHYEFMLQGIQEVSEDLKSRGITFVIKKGDPAQTIKALLLDAHTLVMDYGYLNIQLAWRSSVYDYIKESLPDLSLYMVESDCLAPVKKVYPKRAYAAYALRPYILKSKSLYMDFKELKEVTKQEAVKIESDVELSDLKEVLDNLDIDQSLKLHAKFRGGYKEARKTLDRFLEHKFQKFDDRSDPSLDLGSYMSPYLHFGQISVLEMIELAEMYVKFNQIDYKLFDAFFDQTVVRRELSFNFVSYEPRYDIFEYMTEPWAYQTMKNHESDLRLYIYTQDMLEMGQTHDKYFNAAAKEMRVTGFMAGYMRMYWAKKIMEWTPDMKTAYKYIIHLNNKHFLDGRDPNSYHNIAWCFGKSDRPWQNRLIFGTLRYMNSEGLKRKFDIESYVEKINMLEG